jgi:hypothetical protein
VGNTSKVTCEYRGYESRRLGPKCMSRGNVSTVNRIRSNDVLPNIVRTLLINGYVIDAFERIMARVFLIRLRRRDLLGAEARMILLFANQVSKGLLDRLTKEAQQHGSTPIAIAMEDPLELSSSLRQHTLAEFYELLGGEVRSDLIFDPELKSIMDQLGHNSLPNSFGGTPDDLLEIYSKECLQFLLGAPVRRYGQERRFELLPDGLALGRDKFNIYFDAKAYDSNFHPTADDIRRFGSYIKDFNQRYSQYVGAISVFLVVSGSFSTSKNAIKEKANDLLASSTTPLVLVRAADLAEAVGLLRSTAQHRGAIDWRRIFVPEVFELNNLRKELKRLNKDSVIH